MNSLLSHAKNTILTNISIVALALFLISCSATSDNVFSNTNVTPPISAIGPGIQSVQIFVEPAAGDQVIVNAIDQARKSIWLEMYLLTDRSIINALESAAHAGLDVRVMLEPHPYGSGRISPRETLDKLKATGVQAQSTSSDFALTHEKGMIIDSTIVYIMTCNFTLAALGKSKQTTNREYGIIDAHPAEVQAVMAIFTADWSRTNAQFDDPNLVVSPENSRAMLTTFIRNARKTLLIEAEEMQDSAIEYALVQAAQRGVRVQVILPAPGGGTTDTNSAGINTIKQGEVQVKEDARLYMHAKIIVADGYKAFVGSENISGASLTQNRELGVLVADQQVLNTLSATFQQDWSDAYTM